MIGLRGALVTGANGFLGKALVTRLADSGVPTFGLCRGMPPAAADDLREGVRMVSTSYASAQLARDLDPLDFDVVFHLAASGVDPTRRSIDELVDGNVELTRRVLGALRGRKVRAFVHVGTCSEYGPVAAGERIEESAPLLPTSTYGGIKVAAAHLARALASEMAVPFVGVRLFGAYGPGEAPYRLLPYLCARLRRGEAVDLTPGEQVRDFTFAPDVADGLVRFAEVAGSGEFVNLCSGRGARVRDVATLAAEALGADAALLRFGARPARGDEPPWLVGSVDRMHELLGWAPPTSLEDGIRVTCEYDARS